MRAGSDGWIVVGPVPEWLTNLGDYALVLAAIGVIVASIGRWAIKAPLERAIKFHIGQHELVTEARFDSLEQRWDRMDDRLGKLEAQMNANGGATLRDAVNRIEQRQVASEFVDDQIAVALSDLGHPIVIPGQHARGGGGSVRRTTTTEHRSRDFD